MNKNISVEIAVLLLPIRGGFEEIPASKIAPRLGEICKLTTKEAKELWKLTVDGEDLPAFEDDTPKSQVNSITKAYAKMGEILLAHTGEYDRRAAAATEQEKLDAAFGRKLNLITKEAPKAGLALVTATLGVLQTFAGEKYTVTEFGLKEKKGVTTNREDISQVVAFISEGINRQDKSGMVIDWVFGDACLIAEEMGVLENCVPTEGSAKHRAIQAMNDCKFFKPADRKYPLSQTHYRLCRSHLSRKENGSDLVHKWLEKCVEEKLSCPDLRKELQKAFPENAKPKTGKAEPEEADEEEEEETQAPEPIQVGYLYIDKMGQSFRDEKLHLKAASDSDWQVIDLKTGMILDAQGSEIGPVDPLPAEWKDEEPEAPKKKSKKKSKDETVPEPSKDGEDLP